MVFLTMKGLDVMGVGTDVVSIVTDYMADWNGCEEANAETWLDLLDSYVTDEYVTDCRKLPTSGIHLSRILKASKQQLTDVGISVTHVHRRDGRTITICHGEQGGEL